MMDWFLAARVEESMRSKKKSISSAIVASSLTITSLQMQRFYSRLVLSVRFSSYELHLESWRTFYPLLNSYKPEASNTAEVDVPVQHGWKSLDQCFQQGDPLFHHDLASCLVSAVSVDHWQL
jgi:hypothetical protein